MLRWGGHMQVPVKLAVKQNPSCPSSTCTGLCRRGGCGSAVALTQTLNHAFTHNSLTHSHIYTFSSNPKLLPSICNTLYRHCTPSCTPKKQNFAHPQNLEFKQKVCSAPSCIRVVLHLCVCKCMCLCMLHAAWVLNALQASEIDHGTCV